MVGAAPLSGELMQQFAKVIPSMSFGQGYGMTETCTTVTMHPPHQKVGTLGSAGQLIAGTIAKVVKEDGTLAGYNEEGELHVKGPQMALRYANDAKATRETFHDGWVRTGDQVKITESGDFFVVDRLKEIIKVKGIQVAPAELEGHLLDHLHVADAGVVGVHDEFSGELPLAFIVLTAEARKLVDAVGEDVVIEAIKEHVKKSKAKHKWLEGGVEFIDAIPKNPSGKILRRMLRDRAREARRSKQSSSPAGRWGKPKAKL